MLNSPNYIQSKRLRGFTILEMMIVVAIVGILAALAVPIYQQVNRSSKRSAAENLLRQYAMAATQYYIEHGVSVVNVDELTGSDGYLVQLPHSVFDDATINNGGDIEEGVPIILTLDIGDITYDF